jgi:hypothetical protein
VTALDETLFSCIVELNEQLLYDLKEINVYRMHFLLSLRKRVRNKIEVTLHGRPSIIALSQIEMLIIRYALLRRQKTPGMSKLFIDVDCKIHPSMFERKEVT